MLDEDLKVQLLLNPHPCHVCQYPHTHALWFPLVNLGGIMFWSVVGTLRGAVDVEVSLRDELFNKDTLSHWTLP